MACQQGVFERSLDRESRITDTWGMNMDEALAKYRTVRAIARLLNIAENTVSEYKGKGIPHLQQIKLEALSGGDLRADDEAWRPADPRFSAEKFNNGRRKVMPVRARE